MISILIGWALLSIAIDLFGLGYTLSTGKKLEVGAGSYLFALIINIILFGIYLSL